MWKLFLHATGTPWTQLTLTDIAVAIAVFLVFNIVVEVAALPFRESKHDSGRPA